MILYDILRLYPSLMLLPYDKSMFLVQHIVHSHSHIARRSLGIGLESEACTAVLGVVHATGANSAKQ